MQQPQPLASTSQLISTPSAKNGLPKQVEDDLRVAGCMMIQEAGIMLGLPQSTMATAQVVFHRFYYVSSMLSFGVNDISISALYLSSKLNETPVRLRDLINTYIFLTSRIKHLLSLPHDQSLSSDIEPQGAPWRTGGQVSSNSNRADKGIGKGKGKAWDGFMFEVPGFHDEVFWDWKDVITSSEMQILKRLGFQMQVDLPYSHVINYLKILDLVFEDDVAQNCWSILNDMLLTPLYVIHPAHTLACASILLSTRLKRIPLPKDWYILFDVTWDDIWSCCGTVMNLWHDWGIGAANGDGLQAGKADVDTSSRRKEREDRWRRTWILCESRKAVRKWVEERDRVDEQLRVQGQVQGQEQVQVQEQEQGQEAVII